jgi:hypothetical protein
MTGYDAKAEFHMYLQRAREVLVWKLEGLSEYDIRRPLTPTGTNLLGIVKHVASVELEYFGPVFGRPTGLSLPWASADAEPNADMWATPDESRAEIVDLYHRSWRLADETIAELPLHAPGTVPWGGDQSAVTLHRLPVHMIAETQRHAGHADIVREMIDGSVGARPGVDNMQALDQAWWRDYHDRVEAAARSAASA